ncbi:hypothetical protein [Xanthomonas phage X1]|nr:hypothetical protein [Xanthomonas phage X1]
MNRHDVKDQLEDLWFDVRHWFKNLRLEIDTRINPRQKWLTKEIGRRFVDKDYIIETTIFESMIHFWEEDDGERSTRYQFEHYEGPCGGKALKPEDQEAYVYLRKLYADLDKCYRWAKTRKGFWADCYTNYKPENEKKLEAEDTYYMNEIIRLRKHMWT